MPQNNQPNTVVLTGEYRKEQVQATFERSPKEGWTLYVTVGRMNAVHVLDKSCKPCWTVACEFFAKLSPPKPRNKPTFNRKREIESQTAGYFRVISER